MSFSDFGMTSSRRQAPTDGAFRDGYAAYAFSSTRWKRSDVRGTVLLGGGRVKL